MGLFQWLDARVAIEQARREKQRAFEQAAVPIGPSRMGRGTVTVEGDLDSLTFKTGAQKYPETKPAPGVAQPTG